jgi:hypothetical protein
MKRVGTNILVLIVSRLQKSLVGEFDKQHEIQMNLLAAF